MPPKWHPKTTHLTKVSQSFATADALDMVDYFGAREELAQPWKTSNEEFLPGEWDLEERGRMIKEKIEEQ